MEQITEALKEQFARNIGLVIQQEGSKLRKFVTNESQDTEVIQFETMHTHEALPRHRTAAGYHEPGDGNTGKLEKLTEFRTPKITRRQVIAQVYYWEAAMDRNDKLNLLSDPTSKFPKLAGFAMGRKQDQVIINSFASPVNGGRTGQNLIYFDVVNNVIPVGVKLVDTTLGLHANNLAGGAGGQQGANAKEALRVGGLTVEKLLKAHQLLKKHSFGADEKYYLVCSSYQIGNLLRDSQITSHYYNSVKALVSGEVNSFVGFNFIITEMLGGIRGTANNIRDTANSIRDCYAFTESSIRFGTVTGSVERQIDRLVQYHYALSLYYSEGFGATRTEEGQIVCIKCLEPADVAGHTGDHWNAAADNAHFNGAVHASIVPWQMIGRECRNVDNTDDIKVDALESLLAK
ncbi:phage capsid protein [Rickettsia endosymbiont of Polydrusus tereticollis]|uniref:phage capsid protein n=1 Tax=Rickettsia endosymbiont of Polydrusus tereticollis TaxID=3066251 RepID=UPI003132C570